MDVGDRATPGAVAEDVLYDAGAWIISHARNNNGTMSHSRNSIGMRKSGAVHDYTDAGVATE